MKTTKKLKAAPYGSVDQWLAIKKEIKNTWNQMTEEEIDINRHSHDNLSNLIHKKYNHAKHEVSRKLKTIFSQFGETTDDIKKRSKQMQTEAT